MSKHPSWRPVRAPEPLGFRQQHPVFTAMIPIGLVMIALVTMVVIKTTGGSASASGRSSAASTGRATVSGNGTTALAAGVLSDVTSVSAATLAQVGNPGSLADPVKVSGSPNVLEGADGKPEILYIGAEYCPFCAAERWAVVEALSRFGSFSGLSATHSSTSDVYPTTQTFSFYGSTYSSPYFDFVPVEEETNQAVGSGYATLQTPTASEQKLLNTYDTSPYSSTPGSIPFLDIGNRFIVAGASYTPAVLQGLTMSQIAAQLNDPSSVVAQAIDGTANLITASICAITGDQPASVCGTPTISGIAKKLGA
ncbi:MAG TPA: DUF929 family protein [Acidimicrobiales bacterium]